MLIFVHFEVLYLLFTLQAELQRQRTRLTDENSLLSSENEKLQQRVEDLRNELKDHEEALTQLTVQQNLHSSKLVSESTMLSNSLEKERISREKIEAEVYRIIFIFGILRMEGKKVKVTFFAYMHKTLYFVYSAFILN